MVKKVLVVGGCHTGGYPYKKEDGFIAKLFNRISDENLHIEELTLSMFTLKNYKSLDNILKEFKPDMIILQVGNYECTPNLSKILSKKINKYKILNKNKIPLIDKDQKPKELKWSLKTKIKIYAKYLIHLFTFFKFINYNEFKNNYEQLLNLLHPTNIPILIISPTPTMDLATNFYRKKGTDFIKKINLKGYIFFDLFDLMNINKDLFFDFIHFNQTGHNLVSELIFEDFKNSIYHENKMN